MRARARVAASFATLLVAAAGALGAACSDGGPFLVVTIDSAHPLTATAIVLGVTSGGRRAEVRLAPGGVIPLPPARDVALQIDAAHAGPVTLDAAALSGATVLARGTAAAVVPTSGTARTTIVLTGLGPDLDSGSLDDGGALPDLVGGGPDAGTPPDTAGAPGDAPPADAGLPPDATTPPDAAPLPDATHLPDATYLPDATHVPDLAPGPDLAQKPFALAPVPPTVAPGGFLYQGGQAYLRTQLGTICPSHVAAGMGQGVFCYGSAKGTLRCAGAVTNTTYGSSFVDTGQPAPTQILTAYHASVCIARLDRSAWCNGQNSNGSFGNGTNTPTSQWTEWGKLAGVSAIGTGTFDQSCVILTSGEVLCAGYSFGLNPASQGIHKRFWVDTFGKVNLDDPNVIRAGESRTECVVKSGGVLTCGGKQYGPLDGSVVTGSVTGGGNGVCWLTADASVSCTFGPRFAHHMVLWLAANYYTDSLCAVYVDGSVWCVGSNTNGKLGTGNTAPLNVETPVAPPGSAYVACDG